MHEHATGPRKAAAFGLAITLLVALAGCSGGEGEARSGDGGEDAVEVLEAASTKTSQAGSARMSMTMALDVGGDTATMTGDGVFDLATGRGSMTMTYGAGFAQLSGATFESVFDRTVLYMKFPPGLVPSPKPWVRIDLQAAGEQAGIDLEALLQGAQNEPTQFLQYLKGVSDDVQTVGKEDVRGVSTTHYRATIDLRKAAEALGPEAARSIDNLIDRLGTTTLPAEYWIDGDQLMRRMTMEIDSDGTGPQPPAKVTNELYDFGAPVELPVPPESEVVDVNQLASGGG
jgi:hypothetical protein